MKEISPELYGTIAMLLKSADLEPGHVQRILQACRTHNGNAKKSIKMINAKQAASIANCHAKTIFRAAARGDLTAVRRSSRCVRFCEEDILRWATGGGE